MRSMRPKILLLAAVAIAGCNSGHLGDDSSNPGVSPGTVTLHLTMPPAEPFCDVVSECGGGVSHISFRTQSGEALEVGPRYCATQCSTCTPLPCPAIPVCAGPAVGHLITDVETSWDGSYVQSGSCRDGVACVAPQFVRPGRYIAHMCATPGTVSQPNGPPCTATGEPRCIDVPFDLPGPSTVEATLPALGLPRP
jgi:hypothetical protein